MVHSTSSVCLLRLVQWFIVLHLSIEAGPVVHSTSSVCLLWLVQWFIVLHLSIEGGPVVHSTSSVCLIKAGPLSDSPNAVSSNIYARCNCQSRW